MTVCTYVDLKNEECSLIPVIFYVCGGIYGAPSSSYLHTMNLVLSSTQLNLVSCSHPCGVYGSYVDGDDGRFEPDAPPTKPNSTV